MKKTTMKEKALEVKKEAVELGTVAAKAVEKTAIEVTDGIEDLYERGVKKAKAVKTQVKNHIS